MHCETVKLILSILLEGWYVRTSVHF